MRGLSALAMAMKLMTLQCTFWRQGRICLKRNNLVQFLRHQQSFRKNFSPYASPSRYNTYVTESLATGHWSTMALISSMPTCQPLSIPIGAGGPAKFREMQRKDAFFALIYPTSGSPAFVLGELTWVLSNDHSVNSATVSSVTHSTHFQMRQHLLDPCLRVSQ